MGFQQGQQASQQIQQIAQSGQQGATGLFALTGDADGTPSGDDINIGVGELQECTISKSMDSVSHDVFDFTANERADTGKASVNTSPQLFTVTLSNPGIGDAFDFKTMEEGEAAGQLGRPKYELIEVDSGFTLSDGDGINDSQRTSPTLALLGPESPSPTPWTRERSAPSSWSMQ
jgi:hypothetical protein